MASKKQNGEATELDVEHELPTGEGGDETVSAQDASELETLRAEKASYLDRLARLQAEFDNFRKRSVKEQQDFRDYALAEALKSLLPILDSLDRAAKTPAKSVDDIQSGIELIDKQFHDALARLGVEPIPAAGEAFDPNLHQAVQMVDTEEVTDQHVIDELQRGYRIKERLLRPAMVLVANNPKK
ncbi:MAG TPA: nucleotide exchange factor GrpE [Candidatus Angelobacter sp.]|nr:nucleotide exchange factor GrpE [Candidatus Angelobacter sp.]